MAKMIRCKHCGAEIEKSASRCPECNRKLKHPVVIALCTLIVLAALFFIILVITTPIDMDNNQVSDVKKPSSISLQDRNDEDNDGEGNNDSYDDENEESTLVVIDDDNIYAEFLGFEDCIGIEGFCVRLRITNKTDKKVFISLDEAYVNGEMLSLVMSGVPLKILPGEKGTNDFIFSYAQISIDSFDAVNVVAFKIMVWDDETTDEIELSDEVKIQVREE